MPTKFRKERYITQTQSTITGMWSFRVRFNGVSKVFNENDYLSSSQAFREAVAFKNALLVGINKITESYKTVDDCFNEMSEIYVLRAETKRKLKTFYNKYVNDKNLLITKVTRLNIINDLNNMVEVASDDTINRVLTIWKKIFNLAITKNYVSEDKTLNIHAPKSHLIKTTKRENYVELNVIEDMCDKMKFNSLYERQQFPAIIKVLYYTGMRPCELFALNKTDVDLKHKQLTINKELGSSVNELVVIRQCKTTQSNRIVPLSNKCIPYLKTLIELSKYDKLVCDKFGEYYDITNVGNRLHLKAKTLGYDFHLYQCRHAFITNLFMQGVDIKTIQELVGQKIDATTIGYVVTNKERMKKAIDLV